MSHPEVLGNGSSIVKMLKPESSPNWEGKRSQGQVGTSPKGD